MADPYGNLSYDELLAMAMDDLTKNGYRDAAQVDYWADLLRKAAERAMKTDVQIDDMVREAMGRIWQKEIERGGALKRNPGVKAYTIESVKPELRRELDRRIAANIDLIKLDRAKAILIQESRFRGWSTSIPEGGSKTVARRAEKDHIRKPLASLSYTERRCMIDQGHKMANAINDTVAIGGGAIGAFWHSHKYTPASRARPDHAARNGRFFLLKGSWAQKAGYVKPNKNGYTDDITQPGEEIFCSCAYQWVFSLRSVPNDCMTEKGRDALEEARRKIAAMRG